MLVDATPRSDPNEILVDCVRDAKASSRRPGCAADATIISKCPSSIALTSKCIGGILSFTGHLTEMIRFGQRAFVAAVIGWTALPAVAVHSQMEGTGQPTPLSIGRVRALVISPHPDDATLGAAGLAQRVIRNGGSVQVVQMTGGDAFPKGVTTINPRMLTTPVAYRRYRISARARGDPRDASAWHSPYADQASRLP